MPTLKPIPSTQVLFGKCFGERVVVSDKDQRAVLEAPAGKRIVDRYYASITYSFPRLNRSDRFLICQAKTLGASQLETFYNNNRRGVHLLVFEEHRNYHLCRTALCIPNWGSQKWLRSSDDLSPMGQGNGSNRLERVVGCLASSQFRWIWFMNRINILGKVCSVAAAFFCSSSRKSLGRKRS